MNATLSQIADYLWSQSWQVAMLAAVIGLVNHLLRNRSAHVRYLLWLLVPAKCLVPPVLGIALPILPQTAPPVLPYPSDHRYAGAVETAIHETSATDVAQPSSVAQNQTDATAGFVSDITLRETMVIAWLAGIGLFTVATVLKAGRMTRWLIGERQTPPAPFHNNLREMLRPTGDRQMPSIWFIQGISQPFVWGLFRGDIYLPASFASMGSHGHQRDILAHELSHVLRCDAGVNLLQVVSQALFWFHPFVWWANQRIRAEREKSCDEMAIARLGARPSDYSRALVETLLNEHNSLRQVPSLAVAGPVKNIEERIKTMLRPGKKFYRRPSLLATAFVLLLALLIVPTTLALTRRQADLADAHAWETPAESLAESGLNPGATDMQAQERPQADLEIIGVRFEPIHQGKNVVHVDVKNASDRKQVFATHIYTRSPDYGTGGVGWGTGFFETIRPQENKSVRFVFKIQGPVTERTYVNLRFYNPETRESYDYERYFEQRRYTSGELPKVPPDRTAWTPASTAQGQAVIQAFKELQGLIQQSRYEQAWEQFTEDYRKAEYQVGFERFQKSMEPTQPLHSAFTWEREDFLALTPKEVSRADGRFALTATLDGQNWTIDFTREDDLWKIDWIAGYTPRILDLQDPQETTPTSQASGNLTTNNLKVLDTRFEPIGQGKNVVRVQVQNLAERAEVFGVSVQARSPEVGGWGTLFLDTIEPGKTQWATYGYELRGSRLDDAFITLSFFNPGPAVGFDAEEWFSTKPWDQWFHEQKHFGRDLPQRPTPSTPLPPAPQDQARAVVDELWVIQSHIKGEQYDDAWKLFTKACRDAGFFRRFDSFKRSMTEATSLGRFSWLREESLELKPESVVVRDGVLIVPITCKQKKWTVDFVREDGCWKIDWSDGYVSEAGRTANWEERVLPKMEKRSSAHFDIYYLKDSTAAREIDQIAQCKDAGFDEICRFLGKNSDIRIQMVFFENGDTKQRVTGHQGAGWAYGNTIVEVYNEKERLDPYHETTHILMGPLGSPPALFNEGFATYMSERLGAHALTNLSGGKATIYQRAKELKDKGDWIALPELLGYTQIGPSWSRPLVAYPEAGSFVQFLIEAYGKDRFLQAYGTLRNSGQQAVREENMRSLARIYGQSLEALEEQWLKVISQAD